MAKDLLRLFHGKHKSFFKGYSIELEKNVCFPVLCLKYALGKDYIRLVHGYQNHLPKLADPFVYVTIKFSCI